MVQRIRLESDLKVVLSGGNVGHYHHTALALQQAGYLKDYYCVFDGQNDFGALKPLLPVSWRRRLQGKYLTGLNPQKIKTIPGPYITTQILRRAGLLSTDQANTLFGNWFDAITRHKLVASDVFHFVNGIGLKTARKAKAEGRIVICDVRAEHVDTQKEILEEEYERLGLPFRYSRETLRERLLAEYDLADTLIVPSKYVSQTFQNKGIKKEKLYVVPYGVDINRFDQMARISERENQDATFRVLFVGQIIPRKGIHYLIDAFGKLNLPKSELIVVGKVNSLPYKVYLQKLIRHYESKIELMGQLPHINLQKVYQSSDVFVLPTVSEGSALVVYEAMAAGLPIITTDHAGAVVEDGKEGYIVPIRSVDALKDKLTLLFENSELRKQIGQWSQQRIKDFTWEKYGEELLNAYSEILGSQSKSL